MKLVLFIYFRHVKECVKSIGTARSASYVTESPLKIHVARAAQTLMWLKRFQVKYCLSYNLYLWWLLLLLLLESTYC